MKCSIYICDRNKICLNKHKNLISFINKYPYFLLTFYLKISNRMMYLIIFTNHSKILE